MFKTNENSHFCHAFWFVLHLQAVSTQGREQMDGHTDG